MEEVVISGGKRTRTADILLAKQALYQLSYSPKSFNENPCFHSSDPVKERFIAL